MVFSTEGILVLNDLSLFAIKADQYMIHLDTNEEYTEPVYIGLADDKHRTIVLETEVTARTRIFDTFQNAYYWLTRHNNSCSYENMRVVKIKWNGKEWCEYDS